MKNVKLCDLRLSDMGNTTLGVTAPPYDEIAQETFSVWELFKQKKIKTSVRMPHWRHPVPVPGKKTQLLPSDHP